MTLSKARLQAIIKCFEACDAVLSVRSSWGVSWVGIGRTVGGGRVQASSLSSEIEEKITRTQRPYPIHT